MKREEEEKDKKRAPPLSLLRCVWHLRRGQYIGFPSFALVSAVVAACGKNLLKVEAATSYAVLERGGAFPSSSPTATKWLPHVT